MFRSNSDNMLPRPAPKPSATIAISEAKPTVPEVSILFGQQQPSPNSESASASAAQCPPQKPFQSYASWKKQVLPKVFYPATSADETATTTQISNRLAGQTSHPAVYPLRGAKFTPTTTEGNGSHFATTEGAPPMHYIPNTTPGYTPSPRIDNCISCPANYPQQFSHQRQQQKLPEQRHSLDAKLPKVINASEEVLTICASTQTDTYSSPDETTNGRHNCATKRDFESLLELVQQMREEQLRLTHMCEALVNAHQETMAEVNGGRKHFRDAGTQYEYKSTITQHPKDIHQRPTASPAPRNNMFVEFKELDTQFQSPQTKPSAQSTAYRANTPRTGNQENLVIGLQKSASEKSMVMNELALKYLPGEKINELIQDMHISPMDRGAHIASPLRSMENVEEMEKGPSDISNASYRYLRKYRLLNDGMSDSDFNAAKSPNGGRRS